MIYKRLIKSILFKTNPEKIHNLALIMGTILSKSKVIRYFLKKSFLYKNKTLEQEILKIRFRNPVGLAAGFDKDAKLIELLPSLGFGFTEVGSITNKPCQGNPKPRLFRLPKEKSIIINYGLCNQGAEILHTKLKNKDLEIPLGINIARTNSQMSKEQAIDDFVSGFQKLKDLGDYLVINASCPNTFDDIDFCEINTLKTLLKEINKENISKPVFLKIKPDLTLDHVDKILEISNEYHFIKGFIISNLTKDRTNLKTPKKEIDAISLKGGLSGPPVKEKSNKLIKYVYKKTKGKYTIVGCGGIFNAEDAYQKIKAGASLVQLITGMIYEGPSLIKKINKDLTKLLEKDNYTNIKQAIGVDIKWIDQLNIIYILSFTIY